MYLVREWCWYNLEENQSSTRNHRQGRVENIGTEHQLGYTQGYSGGRSHGRSNNDAMTDHEEIRKKIDLGEIHGQGYKEICPKRATEGR